MVEFGTACGVLGLHRGRDSAAAVVFVARGGRPRVLLHDHGRLLAVGGPAGSSRQLLLKTCNELSTRVKTQRGRLLGHRSLSHTPLCLQFGVRLATEGGWVAPARQYQPRLRK